MMGALEIEAEKRAAAVEVTRLKTLEECEAIVRAEDDGSEFVGVRIAAAVEAMRLKTIDEIAFLVERTWPEADSLLDAIAALKKRAVT